MHIVIVVEKTGWVVRDLLRAAADLEVSAATARWSALRAEVAGGKQTVLAGDVVLTDADAVLLRTIGAGTLEQIVFCMDVAHRLEVAGVPVINPPRAIETAVDKYLALTRIADAGINVPRTIACQTIDDAAAAFATLGGDVVVKPLFGAEGFGITRITDLNLLERAAAQLQRAGSIIYMQQFIDDAEGDVRLLVIGDRVVTSMRRVGDDWRSNIARGAKGEPYDASESLVELALQSARACGALVAGVDILIDRQGRAYVLEVNAAPGWRELVRVTGVDVAQHVLMFVREIATKGAAHA